MNDKSFVEFIPVELVKGDVQKVYVKGLPEKVQMVVVGQDFALTETEVAIKETQSDEDPSESNPVILSVVKQ